MTTKIYYVAYGSNLHVRQMACRCPDAEIVGSTVVEGYRLVFRGSDGHAVATIEPEEGSSVPAMVWRISSRDHRSLDRYEGWPRLYYKTKVDVELDGETIYAMVYIMNDGHSYGAPSDAYLDTIEVGYLTHKFDLDILHGAVAYSVAESAR